MIQLANFEEREFYIDLGEQITACDLTLVYQMTEETFLVRLTADKTNDRATKFSYTATNLPEGQYLASFAKVDGTKLVTVAAFVTGNPIFATSQYNTYNDDGTSTTYVPSDDQGLVPSVSQRLRVKTDDDATDVSYVRTINVTNGTLTDDGNGAITLNTGGGAETLNELTDVDIISPDQGDVLSYNSGVQKWMKNGGLQELLERFKASGTGAQMYDTLNDTTKGYIDILASSATMKVNHSGMTISEASPGVLSFSVAAGTEGNEVEFEAMTIEGSDAFATVADITFKQGALTYWENATGKIWLRATNAGNLTVLLPSSSGTIALTTDIPNVPVDSVNGQTGVVVLDTGDIDENGNLYYTEARVAANAAVAANTAKVGVIAGGTTGQALVKATGTDYDVEWADIAIDTQYHNRFQTDAETFRSGATATTELYYTAKADGDGLAESASSDTPTAGKVIRRKIYYSEAAFADPDTGTWVEFTPAPADDASFATVKAALLEYLKARTGGTVPISLKQTWEEVTPAPAFTGLLNETYGSGAAAAYGTRRLNGNYSGACMTIRRASDGTTQTIGFVGEEIDESAITTFCTGTSCTVQVWHDQSQTGGTGSGNDATQTDPAKQPTIYTGGQLVKEGGRLALDFDGTNDALTNTDLTTNSNETFAIVANYNNASSSGTLFDSAQTDEHTAFLIQSEFRAKFGSNTDMKYGDAATGQKLHWIYKDNTTSSSSYGAIDGGATDALNAGTNNANGITLGNNRVSSFSLNGQMQELVLFSENKTANRTDIEGNISAYYQSAKLLDEQYGSGAEAAYSVRQLKRDNTECMVIRRASDSTTTTIGFDASGNIDEAAIETFCTGTTCTVSEWLDQSGNGNHATAAAPTNEPTIYTGGALVKDNGKVALDFDGSNNGMGFDSSGMDIGSLSSLCVGRYNVLDFDVLFGISGSTNNKRWYAPFANATDLRFGYADNSSAATTTGDTNKHLFTMMAGSVLGNMQSWIDGATVGTATLSSGIDPINGIGNFDGSFNADCNVQEVIIYNSDKSSVRTDIEENVGDYFTQNTPLLDTYTGAAAAYSLRLLDSTYNGSAVEVYNGSSYADIGFNVFGELDTVALAAHCGSNSGYVSKWYSQTGSNDATQTVTGSMPKIYDGTTGVVTENGKPAVEFDGANDFFNTSLNQGTLTEFLYTGVAAPTTTTALQSLIDLRDANDDGTRVLFIDNGTIFTSADAADSLTTYAAAQQLVTGEYDGTNLTTYVDGTGGTSVSGTDTTATANALIGVQLGATSFFMNGTMQELVLYFSDQSTNRTGIETNMNTFYDIY